MQSVNLVIFASGSGSNAENIINYFRGHARVRVTAIFCNNPNAGVLERAERLGVPAVVFSRAEMKDPQQLGAKLKEYGADFIILAGFLWLIPAWMVEQYPDRIINIHPALLPSYGGKGMYGHHVHTAVIGAQEAESGISIHKVNTVYDEGHTLFQARCPVQPGDTPDTLAARIHELEYQFFPRVIEAVVTTVVGGVKD